MTAVVLAVRQPIQPRLILIICLKTWLKIQSYSRLGLQHMNLGVTLAGTNIFLPSFVSKILTGKKFVYLQTYHPLQMTYVSICPSSYRCLLKAIYSNIQKSIKTISCISLDLTKGTRIRTPHTHLEGYFCSIFFPTQKI